MLMKSAERFADLVSCDSVTAWRDLVSKLAGELGYERSLVAIFPNRDSPIEVKYAFLHTSYPDEWIDAYDSLKFGKIDPVVHHCIDKSIPLIWSPDIFFARTQRELYEEACKFGIRSGVTLPIHGTHGELGILCFVNDEKPGWRFRQEAYHKLPELSYLRDVIFETALPFIKPAKLPPDFPLTPRELECVKWCAAGKSSWDISQILHCSEAAVNFHFANLRRKFGVKSRQQVVVKAIASKLINL